SVSGTPIKNWAGANKEKFVYGTEAVPEDVYITNNFLYRNCYGFPGANSLTSFYTTNMQVLHNYLYDSTYGAMSIGWGWCEYDGFGHTAQGTVKDGGPYAGTSEGSLARSPAISTTSRNNKINYNRVEEICTVVNDSGAIYSLGRQGDPGNLLGGGTWDTVNNLTSSPVTDETSNWHPDNWTNYTEMNYNFLDPNPSNKPTTSNNWTNGFHPDEGSTFIKMIGNVVQSKLSHSPGRSRLYEFNNWKRKSDMIAIEGYVDGDNDQNGGPRITFDNYKSADRIWPAEGNQIVLNSGLTDEYTHMIPRSLIADTEFELASNIIMGKGEKLSRRGLLEHGDTVWLAPAGTTEFVEGNTMTKAAGDAKTIDAPSAPGEYKLYIVYADSSKGTATSKYTAYVDTSATAVNVKNGESYEVSAVQPLKLTLSEDYTYTLNGNPVVDGYEIATEGSWDLVLSTPSSPNATTIKFTTTVSEANKLLAANKTVAPGETVRFAYDLNDKSKKIWISSPAGGHFDGGDDETMVYGDKLGITAPEVSGTYAIFVLSKDDEVLSQSHARVVVSETAPVDPSVDKTLLTALIDATDDLDSAVYTTNSWNTFASALSEAQAAASNNEIGQEAADNAYFALRNAFKSLRVATDIFIEAESATVYGPFSGRNWSVVKGQYTQAMHALPDSGYVQSSTSAANLANTPRLSYTVNIPVAGNYTVWVLAKTPSYDSDSLHVGLDNTYKFSANSIHDDSNGAWKWVNLSNRISAGSALQNVTAGQHTLDIWFREDGFAVDRIFLTQSTLTADPVWFGQTAVLDKNSLTLAEGSAGTLTATVTPEDEADKTVTFSSSNEAVATVTGKVYDEETGATSITVNAIAVGTASIIATTANGSQTACDVTVTEKPAPNKNIYVSTTGDDTTGDGTQAKPYKTLAKAKEVVRTLPKTGGDIVVQIADGFY
ncbi:Ig-like domain-containing protein, partial [Anaerobacterium chartisolvens]|uniref:Ig-like domain-containing protein n=1 Tax=Anaerobacterium chartisolvens TaxID=1297424 RepID=UPI001A9A3D37